MSGYARELNGLLVEVYDPDAVEVFHLPPRRRAFVYVWNSVHGHGQCPATYLRDADPEAAVVIAAALLELEG